MVMTDLASRKCVSGVRVSRVLFAAALAAAALVGVAASAQDAQARTYKVLYDFCQQASCTDGKNPNDLVMDGKGRLFGTTRAGGASNQGNVFVLKPGKDGGYTYKVLYDFCAVTCAEGASPLGGLIVDGAGNLFGTTEQGGANGQGTVFALFYDEAAKTYTYKVLYSFCAQPDCADGAHPSTTLTMDAAGTLFGVAQDTGESGTGVVFRLVPNKNKTRWTFTVLHSFLTQAHASALRLDAAGNLFGTTQDQGPNTSGTVFELALNKSTGAYTYRTLYNFCSATDCADGSYPYLGGGNVPLALLADGGATSEGGQADLGTVFKLTPPGTANANTKAKWTETVLYNFCSKGGAGCTDGKFPYVHPVMDSKGSLYGTADSGGRTGGGTIYQLVFNKSNGTYTRRTLYNFCSQPSCADGGFPESGVVLDGGGNLFGTAVSGGAANSGVVYELVND
jgi:uncharacterized repeat protein (TIGR03803 family)